MPRGFIARIRPHPSRRSLILAAAAASVCVLPAASAPAASTFATIGLTQLLAVEPSLTGAGVGVAQVEADSGGANIFEVNPAKVGQPPGIFTYTGDSGQTLSFSTANESSHADSVGELFYGVGTGVAPGISRVDGISANYFIGADIQLFTPTGDAVVNQSFISLELNGSPLTAADQQREDTEFDDYVATFGTIIVSAAGNGGSKPNVSAPSTAYDVISVAASPGPSSVGPTIDNGRSKPDITAPGGATSFTTPLVSGAAALLVQAGARGDGGTSPQTETDAVDFRTVKALLLNGANKQSVTFNRTATAPLDPVNGAGMLNIYNSYMQLAAGKFSAGSVVSTLALGGLHPADTTAPVISSLSGWDFSTLTTTALTDSYANYLFQPAVGVSSYTFTATMDWERQYNPNSFSSLGINNLDLYLYDTTKNTLVDLSDSTVDNVQDVYDMNLSPGDLYDLEVLKVGGLAGITPGVINNSETYALAFNFAPVQSIWSATANGSWSSAANWTGGIPQHAGDTASFITPTAAAATVTLDGNWTVGNINFNNSKSYTIAVGTGGVLTMDNGASQANIIDTGGSHVIAAPVVLNSNVKISVAASGQTLTMSGGISGTGGLEVAGSGKLVLSGASNSVSSLAIDPGATLDIGSAPLTINFASPANDPLAAVQAYLMSGYNGGTWTGTGLTSSAAAANPLALAVGYVDGNLDAGTAAGANQILIKLTLTGDADLTGSVGFNDLVVLAQNFGDTGKDWSQGNFSDSPDGSVGFNDLVMLAQNFGDSTGQSSGELSPAFIAENTAATPEPGVCGLMAMLGVGLLRRRRTQSE